MKNILIIEPNWLGDILFTTPAIRAVRENNPDAYIAVMCVSRCVEMLDGNPHINEIIVFDEENLHKNIIGKISFILNLRKKKFEIAFLLHRSMTRALIAALAGIPCRVGYPSGKNNLFLTDKVPMPEKLPHRVEYFLKITAQVGFYTTNKNYEFFIPKQSFDSADAILENSGIGKDEKFIMINPGANWLPKRWPAKNYAGLCKELKARYGFKIVIAGAKKDIQLAEEIINQSAGSAVSICGMTTIKQLGAVMQKALLVIANDSGPMHIAVSQKTPTVAIFGPTSPGITGPYGDGKFVVLHKWSGCNIPCYKACEEYKCMEAVMVEDVLAAVEKLI